MLKPMTITDRIEATAERLLDSIDQLNREIGTASSDPVFAKAKSIESLSASVSQLLTAVYGGSTDIYAKGGIRKLPSEKAKEASSS
jgi:molecular chaperone GrpE (heat shock protein)